MLNSKPNNSNYHQGNYIPINKDKVLKLNAQGGIYYRSSWELKLMQFFDKNKKVVMWSSENIQIPYQLTHYEKNGDINLKSHCYYPDFYYEVIRDDGSLQKVVAEVKPKEEYNDVVLFEKKLFKIPKDANLKKLKSVEFKFKMAQKNSEKWKTMIKYCDLKGWDFIIITEDHLKKMGLL